MVEVLVLGEIYLSDVCGRLVETAADADDETGDEQQVGQRGAPLVGGPLRPEGDVAVELVEGDGSEDEDYQADREIGSRHAGTGLGRRLEILQTAGVELETPEGIEAGVGDESGCEGNGYHDVVDAEDDGEDLVIPPAGDDCHEEGDDEQVEGCGEVEGEPVDDDVPQVGGGEGMTFGIGHHKHHLRQDEHHYRQQVEFYQI